MKLKDIVPKVEAEERAERQLTQHGVYRFVGEHTKKGYFVFYRAEHIADKPRLNEDSSGQLGKGVYFTASKDVAKRFRWRIS